MAASDAHSTSPDTIRAIAFVDCCGFTSFTAAHGDLAALRLHRRLRRGLEAELVGLPIEIVTWMGDGVMLASEDTNAMLAGLYHAMIRARDMGSLPIRAGVAVGPVIRSTADGLDYIGRTVNRAARLCDAAGEWQVRLSTEQGAVVHYRLRPATGAAPRWAPRPARDAAA